MVTLPKIKADIMKEIHKWQGKLVVHGGKDP
jgi:hypothetical protein